MSRPFEGPPWDMLCGPVTGRSQRVPVCFEQSTSAMDTEGDPWFLQRTCVLRRRVDICQNGMLYPWDQLALGRA
jgi:hypothetical protein